MEFVTDLIVKFRFQVPFGLDQTFVEGMATVLENDCKMSVCKVDHITNILLEHEGIFGIVALAFLQTVFILLPMTLDFCSDGSDKDVCHSLCFFIRVRAPRVASARATSGIMAMRFAVGS